MTTETMRSEGEQQQKPAFCPACTCSFPDWVKKCPVCSVALQAGPVPAPPAPMPSLPYEELTSLVQEQGGMLTIPMRTVEVAKSQRWSFPYIGRGFSWAKRLEGDVAGSPVTLRTRDVGMRKAWGFPYQGYGYAWTRGVAGHIAGNPATLETARVEMKKSWGFPYFGFGFAWTQEMTGHCGERLHLRFVADEVATEKKWRFPYFGFGFAWVATGELTIVLQP